MFPDDYINSKVGSDEANKIALQKFETFCKRPPSKRPNYQKINSLNPFKPNIEVSNDYNFFTIASF